MIGNATKLYHLGIYEEIIGFLVNLSEDDDVLLATIGKITIILPMELRLPLWPFLGRKIAILRTDLPNRQYLWRSCDENPELARGRNSVNLIGEISA